MGRMKRVGLGETVSNWLEAKSGVSQSSFHCLMLFIIDRPDR